jgi:hypothetical protein
LFTSTDFLLGRGGETNNHSGNILFRQLIKEFKEAYQNAPKTQKPLISQKLVAKWRGMSPPGRFLERNEQDKVWIDVGDVVACRKTSKALGERGKRNKHGHSDTDEDLLPAVESTSGNKRKMEDLNPNDILRSPPASRVTPSAAAPTTGSTPVSTGPVYDASSAGTLAANNGPSSFLQSLGMTNQATVPTARTAAVSTSISTSGNGLAALIEQHQRQQQQQQSSIAALLELQTRQQQQLLLPKVDLAGLLGQTIAPAGTTSSTTTDLAAWLTDQQAKQDLAALLLQTTRSMAATGSANLTALLMGQQQQQKRQSNLSALLPQNAATPTSAIGINDLATLLGQKKPQNDIVDLLQQEQKKQQAQSSLASLLDQHPQPSEMTALFNRSQQAQSTLAALMDQQQQTPGLVALLEQQKKQQLENSVAALLDQHHQLDLAALLGQQPKVTPEQLQSTIAALLEQQQKTQQLHSSLAAVLGHQPTQQHIHLATLLQQQAKPMASGTATRASGLSGERVNSILATTVPRSVSQSRDDFLLAAVTNSTRSLDSKPPAVPSKTCLSDLWSALVGEQQGTTPSAAVSVPACASGTSRLQSFLGGSQDSLAPNTSAYTNGGASPHGTIATARSAPVCDLS